MGGGGGGEKKKKTVESGVGGGEMNLVHSSIDTRESERASSFKAVRRRRGGKPVWRCELH